MNESDVKYERIVKKNCFFYWCVCIVYGNELVFVIRNREGICMSMTKKRQTD